MTSAENRCGSKIAGLVSWTSPGISERGELLVATRHTLYGLDGVNFFIAAMQAGFGTFVTVYLVRNQWPLQAIGFALTISTVSSLISQVPAGAFIDNIRDKRRAVRLGTIGVGVAAALLALTPAKPAVYLAQALQGLASSLIMPGIAAISLASVGHAAFSERVGRNARFASIGNGLTAGAMGLAGSYFEPVSIFWLAAALTVPALLSLSIIRSGHAEKPVAGAALRPDDLGHEDTAITWISLTRLFLDRRLLIFTVCIVLYFVSSAALLPGVAVRVTRLHPELATLIVAATMLLPQAIVAIISPWVGRTAERSGRRPMLLLGWGLLPLQSLLFAVGSDLFVLTICLVLNGISGAVFGVMMTVVAGDITRGTGRFNLTLGVLGAAISVGAALSTSFAGVAAAAFGGEMTYLGFAFAGLCGLLLVWFDMPETHARAA
jgi:MFS family permease